jgi:hypothetical protein
MWNEADDIIKERLFGLDNHEGNHGEDVKEAYFYLDNLPSHAYMKGLYRYPYRYPYEELVKRASSINPFEYELIHTGALNDNRFFDVLVEYAKAAPEDILVRITVVNQPHSGARRPPSRRGAGNRRGLSRPVRQSCTACSTSAPGSCSKDKRHLHRGRAAPSSGQKSMNAIQSTTCYPAGTLVPSLN